VHVHREEGLACALERLPLRNKRLAAVAPSCGGRLDTTRVERQSGPVRVLIIGDNLSFVIRATLVGVVELDDIRTVPIASMLVSSSDHDRVSLETYKYA
jgi:hypothetical protein